MPLFLKFWGQFCGKRTNNYYWRHRFAFVKLFLWWLAFKSTLIVLISEGNLGLVYIPSFIHKQLSSLQFTGNVLVHRIYSCFMHVQRVNPTRNSKYFNYNWKKYVQLDWLVQVSKKKRKQNLCSYGYSSSNQHIIYQAFIPYFLWTVLNSVMKTTATGLHWIKAYKHCLCATCWTVIRKPVIYLYSNSYRKVSYSVYAPQTPSHPLPSWD